MNWYIILIYLIILVIVILISRVVSFNVRPVIKDTINDKTQFKTFTDYMTSVYCPEDVSGKRTCDTPFPKELIIYNFDYKTLKPANKIDDNINIRSTLRYFNYIYDNAPRQFLEIYPIADNLSFSWPPKLGSRYKLTAFPYPKSKNTFGAIYSTIANTVDAYTFPGWSIQRRNPLDFNNSIYNQNYFRSYQNVEIVHACYPLPGQDYPFCDDGGYWMYLAVGSGVFWNTGKCFVSLNKISLLVDIYNCSLKIRNEIAEKNKKNGTDNPLPPILGLSVAQIVEQLSGKGGGYSITTAIFSIINSLLKHSKTTPIIGFKNMKSSNDGETAWNNFITQTFVIFYIIVIVIIQFILNVRGKDIKTILMLLLFTIIIIAGLLAYHFFVIFEHFFRGLGWITLDIALKETNMTLTQFVEECVTGNLRNPICNSLAMTQIFDIAIENFTYAMGYDSFILTSQPNKTGNWEVEICDLRKFNAATLSKGVIKGGVCGNNNESNIINTITGEGTIKKYNPIATPNFDECKNKIIGPYVGYILSAGPIKFDNSGPPFYVPTQECTCIENKDRLCTSCKGYLSAELCVNKTN